MSLGAIKTIQVKFCKDGKRKRKKIPQILVKMTIFLELMIFGEVTVFDELTGLCRNDGFLSK